MNFTAFASFIFALKINPTKSYYYYSIEQLKEIGYIIDCNNSN